MIVALWRHLRRHLPLALSDLLVVWAALLLAWLARSITARLDIRPALPFALLAAVVYLWAAYALGLYHRLWRYAAASEVVSIAGAVGGSAVVLILADANWPGRRPVPLGALLLMPFFAFGGLVAVRYRRRVWTGLRWRWLALRGEFPPARTRVLIVGAGEAGQLLAWRLLNQRRGEAFHLVGFVDDDPAKLGMRVHGRPVLGDRHAIPALVARHRVEMIVIAIYHLPGTEMRAILDLCERTAARIKVLPDLFDFMQTTNGAPPIRDVTTEDLLGRHPVQIDRLACRALLGGRTVLVTGAAGSIGAELCRQVAAFAPGCLLMLDNNESGLHDLSTELAARPDAPPCRSLVADVTRRARLARLFAACRPEIVFHAAAYKHVPLMEEHPDEAVRVNVLGLQNALELACAHGAERFVFISTDKAVNPSCVMGASKRLGELLVAAHAGSSSTLCTGVRFGNVLGSRGSVVPTFERQIASGGPVTVTHPEMTRYFMSIPEAVSLVIQAAAMTQGGDLFVLDMGQPIAIVELAERLIRLRGLRPGDDIPIVYTGIRPGEKLHEELVGPEDSAGPTAHPAVRRLRAPVPELASLLAGLRELDRLVQDPADGLVVERLWQLVGHPHPAGH